MTRIILEVSDKNESTSYPWWLILDPGRMWEGTINGVAAMITGPFFSRAAAQAYLDSHVYNFSDKAGVYCHTGHKSTQYVEAFEAARQGAPAALPGECHHDWRVDITDPEGHQHLYCRKCGAYAQTPAGVVIDAKPFSPCDHALLHDLGHRECPNCGAKLTG